MIRKNTINFENILKVLSSNKNNKLNRNIKLDVKNKDVITIELNKQAIDLLNLNFIYFKNNYDLSYDKYKVLLTIKRIEINNKKYPLIVYSILNYDDINTFIIFSKYEDKEFLLFLNDIVTLKEFNNKVEYNIPHNNNKKLYGKSRKLKNNNKLRYKFNKQYKYLNSKEQKFLNRHSNKVIYKIENNRFWDMDYTYLEWLDLKYKELESLDYCSEEYDEVLYDIKELEHYLKKDVRENMFYSSINY